MAVADLSVTASAARPGCRPRRSSRLRPPGSCCGSWRATQTWSRSRISSWTRCTSATWTLTCCCSFSDALSLHARLGAPSSSCQPPSLQSPSSSTSQAQWRAAALRSVVTTSPGAPLQWNSSTWRTPSRTRATCAVRTTCERSPCPLSRRSVRPARLPQKLARQLRWQRPQLPPWRSRASRPRRRRARLEAAARPSARPTSPSAPPNCPTLRLRPPQLTPSAASRRSG